MIISRICRTDNEIKNYWNSHPKAPRAAKKRSQQSTSEKRKPRKKNEQSSGAAANQETTKTKVYLHKAVRVSPYFLAISNMGLENMAAGSSSLSSHTEENTTKANDPEVTLNDSPASSCPLL
ncbi:MYB-like transcription factor ODO1 [Mangifera indica]|uniref:MYB-like transcription factor ODO1 n=1 Tax=Mangifera indica TaxID=29780 RepID=UPI001CFA55EF|nr:MYB-like transcription factor ODO1 [Mangifera indica]